MGIRTRLILKGLGVLAAVAATVAVLVVVFIGAAHTANAKTFCSKVLKTPADAALWHKRREFTGEASCLKWYRGYQAATGYTPKASGSLH